MLRSLSIRRIGVIDDASIEFGPGFTALTGETGAGKTMVITGLGLLMGRRLDSRRAGVSSTVSGRVGLAPGTPVHERLDELGAEVEDGEILVVRRVTKDGRSRAHIGGVPVPVGTLGEIVGGEITIHGQSDQLRLREPAAQLGALDSVLGAEGRRSLAEHRLLFREFASLERELKELSSSLRDREQREAELTEILQEIEQAGTFEGEDDALRTEIERLDDAAQSLTALEGALMHLAGDEASSVLTHADAAAASLTQAPGASQVLDRIIALRDESSDIAREISLLRDGWEASPGRLEEAQERLHELTVLVREYGRRLGGAENVSELLLHSREALEALRALEDGAARLDELDKRRVELDAELARIADALSGERHEAAAKLAAEIENELAGLEMPGASLRIDVTPAPRSASGTDGVSFTMQPHPGAEYMPVATGASGGELSRVMLALEVAIASLADVSDGGAPPVFVFDEIDAGIGGRAARAVGERLSRLAENAQVIVVTHLPQVASWASCHVRIVKETHSDGGEDRTVSRIEPLEGEARVRELARMLAGDAESDAALEHAAELLATSTEARGA